MSLPRAAAPTQTPTPPKAPVPALACDAHVHMVADDFPLWDGRVEDPAPGTLAEWGARLDHHLTALGPRARGSGVHGGICRSKGDLRGAGGVAGR